MIVAGMALIGSGVGAVAFAPALEPHLRRHIAASLGEILGTRVDVGALKPAWIEGGLALENVVVHNPPGYKEEAAAVLDRVLIQPEVMTVFSKSPTLACVVLEGTQLKLRYRPGEGTNLGYFKERAKAAEQVAVKGEGGVLVKQVVAEGATLDLVPGPTLNIDLKPVSLGTLSIPVKDAASATSTVAGLVDALMKQASAMQGLVQPLMDLIQSETAAKPAEAAKPAVSLDIPAI